MVEVFSKSLGLRKKRYGTDLVREEYDLLQKTILVGLQLLIPPMRGKPFWALHLTDDGKNSMEDDLNGKSRFHFIALDCLVNEGSQYSLLIREQKTAKQMGAYRCPLKPPLGPLIGHWAGKVRGQALHETGAEHDLVFLRCGSGCAFTQQSFSKYITAAFKEIVGAALNLQTVRRLFTEGMRGFSYVAFLNRHSILSEYLKDHHSPTEWQWMATSMLTGVPSLRKVYFRDGLQKQSHLKV